MPTLSDKAWKKRNEEYAKARQGALKAEKLAASKWFPDPSDNNPEAVCRGDQRAHAWKPRTAKKWTWSATSQEPLGPGSLGMSRKRGEADSLAMAKRQADAWLKSQDKANG